MDPGEKLHRARRAAHDHVIEYEDRQNRRQCHSAAGGPLSDMIDVGAALFVGRDSKHQDAGNDRAQQRREDGHQPESSRTSAESIEEGGQRESTL